MIAALPTPAFAVALTCMGATPGRASPSPDADDAAACA